MAIGQRIQKIRELRGMNQKVMAAKMNLTPQSYGSLEEKDNFKLKVVQRFCEVADIDPSFLLAEDVPVTEETIAFFDSMRGKSFLLSYEQLKQKVEVYSEVLQLNPKS